MMAMMSRMDVVSPTVPSVSLKNESECGKIGERAREQTELTWISPFCIVLYNIGTQMDVKMPK